MNNDVADPDISYFEDAFKVAFIAIVELPSSTDGGPSNSSIPFNASFQSEAAMDQFFVGPNGQRGTTPEDSMFWTVYIAGIYEYSNADLSLDNDHPNLGDQEFAVMGLTRVAGPEYSVIPMEVIRDVGAQHMWGNSAIVHIQRIVALHEIGHQFLGIAPGIHDSGNFPGHVMTVPSNDNEEAQSVMVGQYFRESDIRSIRLHGRSPNTHP